MPERELDDVELALLRDRQVAEFFADPPPPVDRDEAWRLPDVITERLGAPLRERLDRPILHELSAGPLRWHTCAGCGKPWPCPDAPLTDREQDRLDEWRMDEEGRDV